jgi:predicted ATP-binding protein involved in virulence
MTIFSEIYNAFNPAPLPANSELYVDCKAVRGGSDVLVELGKTIRFSDRPTCQLYTGHRGGGKSTELLRLKQDLEQKGCTVVYFSAEDEDVNPEDVEYTDILLACTRHLLEQVNVADPKPVLSWLRERGQVSKDLLLTDISLEDSKAEVGIKEFAKITSSIRTQPIRRTKLRELLNPYTEKLVDALNAFIADAKLKLPQSKRRVVMIVDGLEKAVPVTKDGWRTNYDEIFFDRAEQLKGFDFDVIYTVPISLVLSSRVSDLMEIYNYPNVLPTLMTETRQNEPNSAAIEILKSIVWARVWSIESLKTLSQETEIFDSPETFQRLCLMSGGHLRNLLLLMQTAIKYNEDENLPIRARSLSQAVRQLRKTYRDTVNEDQWNLLAAVYRSKQIPNDEAHQSLLFTRCVLEYRDEEVWYDVHPVLRDTPELAGRIAPTQKRKIKNLLISKVEIENIRCFEKIELNLYPDKKHVRWSMLLGDNAVGKTTLLRCIVLGLCNESDSISLMQSNSGSFLKKGTQEGYITIHLREDSESKRPKTYEITTYITQNPDESEIVRKKTKPNINFPWLDIFVCAYGTYRSAQSNASFEKYEIRDAVSSLFAAEAALQNPEIVLLRHDIKVRQSLEKKLLQILMLDELGYKINFTKRGLELNGPWGCLPFQVLSDGYRSTTQWVLDFIGWIIHAERFMNNPDIGGILLIDEIEQHLHPRWQRYIVRRLRQQFPKTQIIASTHTPLAASGIVDEEDSLLLKLEQELNGIIDLKVLDKKLLAGKRADQVLTSEAFGLITTRNPGSEDEINRYTALLSKGERTEAEETELQALKLRVQNTLRSGENAVEQMVATAVDETLQNMTQNISPEMLNIETRKQLQQLFHPEAAE